MLGDIYGHVGKYWIDDVHGGCNVSQSNLEQRMLGVLFVFFIYLQAGARQEPYGVINAKLTKLSISTNISLAQRKNSECIYEMLRQSQGSFNML